MIYIACIFVYLLTPSSTMHSPLGWVPEINLYTSLAYLKFVIQWFLCFWTGCFQILAKTLEYGTKFIFASFSQSAMQVEITIPNEQGMSITLYSAWKHHGWLLYLPIQTDYYDDGEMWTPQMWWSYWECWLWSRVPAWASSTQATAGTVIVITVILVHSLEGCWGMTPAR